MAYIGRKKVTAYFNGKQIFMPLYGLSEKVEIEVPDTPVEPDTPTEGNLTAPTISLDGDILTMTATDDRTQEFVIFVDGVETATVEVSKEETPETLTAPEIFIDGNNLIIVSDDERIETFLIFADGVQKATIDNIGELIFDLSTLNLSAGTHGIMVQASTNSADFLDSPASNTVFYTVKEQYGYVLSGTWVFNETIDMETISDITESVKIGDFTTITLRWDEQVIMYDDLIVYDGTGTRPDTPIGWQNEDYRTITFDGTQTVSEEFYAWFVANAVKQHHPEEA